MSRDDGFAVMDVSADYVNDPKWRQLQRHAPDHLGTAFIAYTATMCASWKAGRRVTVRNAWPSILPFDEAAVEALQHARLLDRTGLIVLKTWREWYETAHKRRETARDRWHRYNETRRVGTDDHAVTAELPRGSDADTASSVLPSVRPPGPPETEQGGTPLDGGPRHLGLVEPLRDAG